MGTTYSFTLQVGYSADQDLVNQIFEETIPGEFHFEDRFDPKTGQKIDSVKIWDKLSHTFIVINGEKIDEDPEQISSCLAEILDCNVSTSGHYYNGDLQYNFTPKLDSKEEKYIDYGKIYVYNPSMSFKDVVALEDKINLLYVKLTKLGIKVGEPKVWISSSIG